MLRQIAAHGGIYVQADSPLQGFPGAFRLDLSKERSNFPAILKKIESTVVEKGARGRLATWPYPSGFGITAALGEFAKRLADGKAKPKDMDQLIDSMNTSLPSARTSSCSTSTTSTTRASEPRPASLEKTPRATPQRRDIKKELTVE